ncbi:MAG: hypothetical protein NTW49_15095 [Bacteroidia bacterium]|nr:hypothetical protein [Bacteroidia bacterium]
MRVSITTRSYALRDSNAIPKLPDSDLILTKYFIENLLYFLAYYEDRLPTALVWRRIYYGLKKSFDDLICERKLKNYMNRITTLSSCVQVIEEMQKYEKSHGSVRHRIKTEEELRSENIKRLFRDKQYRARVKRWYKIFINQSKCQNHEECTVVKVCPSGAFTRSTGKSIPVRNPRKCICCRECERNCPNYAIFFHVK